MLKVETAHSVNKQGYYKIENYDKTKPFSSFFSGIAGVDGKPLWTFYVNRGQGISSFGIQDKSKAIMEFFPANEAYKQIYTTGFRTFIKIDETVVYEPFGVTTDNVKRTMFIRNNDLILEEENQTREIRTKVTYFTLPNEHFPGFVRNMVVENVASESRNIEIIDGLPAILPPGSDNQVYKAMSNTMRSWMQADVLENGVGVYKLRSSTGDTSRITEVLDRYFSCSFNEEGLLETIVNPDLIFGHETSLQQPIEFITTSVNELTKKRKSAFNQVPCAFTGVKKKLSRAESTSISTVIGYVKTEAEIQPIVEKITKENYLENKQEESNQLINNVTKHVETKTGYPLFDEYVKQCYVDNVLRGGYPIQLKDKVYYIYSRKHGDIERDYNFFTIDPTYYSQGNGNFRDLNQNRRLDTYFHPFVGKENIKLFYSLIQLDGYNPLVIKGKQFIIHNQEDVTPLLATLEADAQEQILAIVTKLFTVGQLVQKLKEACPQEMVQSLLEEIIHHASEENDAEYGEGFWVDHWTYNLDFIESYLDIYPEERHTLLYDEKDYRFFNSPEYVLPRSEKYVLEDGKVRQYEALAEKEGNEKWAKTIQGETYTATLMAKLMMLSTIKFMTLDPQGLGIEMEANKPGWNDAMNGLPGLIGSSTAEVFELKRVIDFIDSSLVDTQQVDVPKEFSALMKPLQNVLKSHLDGHVDSFNYWDQVSGLREDYRQQTKGILSGEEGTITGLEFKQVVKLMNEKLEKGIKEMRNLCHSYVPTFLYYDVNQYEITNVTTKGTFVKPLSFTLKELPAFLEGPARYLKLPISENEKKEVYRFVRQSGVYDEKLKMYKTSTSLEDETFEIGRARGFTAGWLERESVFMHMEFKYLLSLISSGMYEEYFEDIQTALPPFMNPDVYGRSVLENSSFIASSANPDEKHHGRGFIARLSGTTIEFLNMWKMMMAGKELFTYKNHELTCTLSPVLTKDFFDEDNKVSFTLLGKTKVYYHNPKGLHTFGENGGKVTSMNVISENQQVTVDGNQLTGELAEQLRAGKIHTIYAVIG